MASGKIRGITVEIGGDTTKLGKALRDSENNSRSLQKELKEINKMLKDVDPGNTELLAQKQKLLTEQVKETTKKLDLMKEAEKQVIEQFERGEIGEDQLRAFQREIIKTEKDLNGMEKELADTDEALNKLANGSDDATEEIEDLNDATENAGESAKKAEGGFTVMKGALANLVAEGVQRATDALIDFGKESINVGMDFQSSMSEVQAISGATGKDFELLENTAKEFGSTTVFSASECAQALKYMSLAGWSAQQSADGLSGVLSLASASGMDLASASDMVTDYLSAFGMEAKESAYFADMLAYAQANSNTSVDQLSEAYKNCSATLNASGQDVETVTALLAQMANQGFKGSEAGTALTAIMRDMTAKMKDGAIMIGDTSIAVQDANGNYRDMTDILKDVENATNGMGDAERATALSATFTADSTKGLNLLLNAGVGSAEEFEKALRGAGGTAEEMGDIMNDNASGDIKAMQSAIEDLQISLFDELEPTIRAIVQTITEEVVPVVKEEVIPAIKEFIDFVLNNGDSIVAVISGIATGFVAWNVAQMVMGVVGAIKAFTVATEGASLAMKIFNAVGKANVFILLASIIATVIVAIVTFIATNEEARAKVVEIWEKIKEVFGSVVESLVTFFTVTVPEAFSNFAQATTDFFVNAWNNIVTFFTEGIPNFINSIIEWFSSLPEKIGYILGYALGTLIKWGADALNWVITNVPIIVENVIKFFRELPGKIWDAIVGAISKISEWVSTLKDKATTGVRSLITSVISFMSELPGKIWNAIKSAPGKIATMCSDMKTKATDGIRKVASAITDKLKEIPGDVANIGRNIVEGLWDGIKNATGWIKEKVGGFAKGILDGMKDALGIKSPSRAFRDQVGKFIAEGIGVGIAENEDSPLNALEKVSEDMLNSAQGINGITLNRQLETTFNGSIVGGSIGDLVAMVGEYMPKLIEASKKAIVLDSGVLVGETINQIDTRLQSNYTLRARGV